MSDVLLQVGLSNLILSGVLAVVAWGLQRGGRFPRTAHLLWLLVLLKLVTPSFLTVPIIELPGEPVAPIAAPAFEAAPVVLGAIDPALPEATTPAGASGSASSVLLWIWLVGSLFVLVWSVVQIARFDRLLRAACAMAPDDTQRRAARLAARLGLRKTPAVYTTSARVSPLVWWVGGRVRVVVPADLLRAIEPEQVDWVLAHELAHVRRGDHLVRWLEWLTCVVCWWNPIAWWARNNLRANEEVCCDALVLATLRPPPRTYARCLLRVVEFLSAPALRPPALASGINGGGSLERRFKMIVSAKSLPPSPRWLRALVLLCVLALLPLGIARAGEGESEDKRAQPSREEMEKVKRKIRDAVESGALTAEEGRAKLDACRKRWERKRKTHDDELKEVNGRKLHKHKKVDWDAIKERIEDAVARGEMSREEADAKYEAIRKELAEHERWARIKEEIEGAVKNGTLTREEADAKYKEIKEKKAADRKRAERIHQHLDELKKRLKAAVERGELTADEAELKYKAAKKELAAKRTHADLAEHFKKLGISKKQIREIHKSLKEAGLNGQQIEMSLGAITRIMHHVKKGENELHPELRKYLEEKVELTAAQVELVHALAQLHTKFIMVPGTYRTESTPR